jgi:hypothetical protein
MKTVIGILLAAIILTSTAISQEAIPVRPRNLIGIPRPEVIPAVNPNAVTVARLHYGGGGDWYWGNSAVPNLLTFIKEQTSWPVDIEEKQVKVDDQELFSYPFLFATGNGGGMKFSADEAERLRQYLLGGGFLFINDSYGLYPAVQEAVKTIFPEKKLEEIPYDHPIYHSFYDFPNGPPKIHEHDGKPATGWGISINGRLVIYYVYQCDIGDGWEDAHVYNDPPEKRLEALKMGLNIVAYAMGH